jgi:hypothetical protein
MQRPDSVGSRHGDANPVRRANLRTALTLLSIAAVFFGGIIASQYTASGGIGVGVVGLGIIGFLLAAVGRGVGR